MAYSLSATPDQLASIGSYIAREWGDYGYRIASLESPTYAVTLAVVRHSDGSEFHVIGDRYGNCQAIPVCCAPELCPRCAHEDGYELHTAAVEAIKAMHANAVAA